MTGPDSGHQGRLAIDGAMLRRRLADAAVSIARTEDQVAETLERMALALPEDATRLQEHAQRARRFATQERDHAASLGLPPAAPGRFSGLTRLKAAKTPVAVPGVDG